MIKKHLTFLVLCASAGFSNAGQSEDSVAERAYEIIVTQGETNAFRYSLRSTGGQKSLFQPNTKRIL